MNRPLTLALTLAALTACGKETAEDPAQHACDNAGVVGATAAAVAEGESPAVLGEDQPTLYALTDGVPGYVMLIIEADEALLLFADTADVVTGLWDDSDADILPEGGPNELCPEDIPEHFDLDLSAGTYLLELGPAAVPEVWLMLTPSEGHGHDE